MIRQAAKKSLKFADKHPTESPSGRDSMKKLAKDVNKMTRVANRHSTIKGKARIRGEGQAALNRLRGENKG
jgi:hypothetical protein